MDIAGFSPARVEVLRRSRQTILKGKTAAEAVESSEQQRVQSLEAAEYVLHGLVPDLSLLRGEALADRVDDLIEESKEGRAILKQQAAVLADAENDWRAAQAKLEEARQRLPVAETRARELASTAGLPADVDLLLAKRQVSGYSLFESSWAQYLSEQSRVVQMTRAVEEGTSEARQLCALCDLDDAVSLDVMLSALRSWHEEGRALQEQRSNLGTTIAQLKVQISAAEAGKLGAEAKLADLLDIAGGIGLQDLPAAIQSSDRVRNLESSLQRLRTELVKAMDGLDIAAIQRHFEGEDRSQWAARRVELEATVADLAQQQVAAGSAQQSTQIDLQKFGDSDALIQEEAKRQSAISDMRDAAERYVALRTQLTILKWALGKYREQAQGPMLTRASEYFRRLTLGRYKGLALDIETDPPRLVPVLSNDRFVDQAHLSDGTLKPFYLALRLASIEIYLEANPGMVFIADDIFVEMDDERAAAGFEILGEIAEKEQVIYLTHHQHLAEIAKYKVVGVQVQHLVRSE